MRNSKIQTCHSFFLRSFFFSITIKGVQKHHDRQPLPQRLSTDGSPTNLNHRWPSPNHQRSDIVVRARVKWILSGPKPIDPSGFNPKSKKNYRNRKLLFLLVQARSSPKKLDNGRGWMREGGWSNKNWLDSRLESHGLSLVPWRNLCPPLDSDAPCHLSNYPTILIKREDGSKSSKTWTPWNEEEPCNRHEDPPLPFFLF